MSSNINVIGERNVCFQLNASELYMIFFTYHWKPLVDRATGDGIFKYVLSSNTSKVFVQYTPYIFSLNFGVSQNDNDLKNGVMSFNETIPCFINDIPISKNSDCITYGCFLANLK